MKRLLVLESSAVIIGTVIGAGILSLPFAFAKAGFWTGSLVLIIIAACVVILSLFLGEVTLRTKGTHQLTGYTELYLGKIAKHFQALILLFGLYSALLAYMIGQGEILSSLLGGRADVWSIVFYIALSILVIKGLGLIKKAEFIIALLILGFIFILVIISTPHLIIENLTNFKLASFFIPYGAILFACSGVIAIPEAKEILSANKGERSLKSAILIGNIAPIIIYIIFAAVIVGVTGADTTEIATIGLSSKVGLVALAIGSLFAIVAMSSSFMTIGIALKEIFQYDYHLKPKIALSATLAVPMIFFLIGFRDFFGIVSVAGALSVGLTGLLTLYVFWRARRLGKRKPEYSIPAWFAWPASFLIAAVFILGLIYTL